MSTQKHNLVLLSGGMDSATALMKEVTENGVVSAVSILYGQRHEKEINAARMLVAYLRQINSDSIGKHYILDLTGALDAFRGSALTSPNVQVPEGHYEDASMKKTVVPNRNMILLSLAAGTAIAGGHPKVIYGAHAGDHAIYPDCRPEFFNLVGKTVKAGNYEQIELEAPFIKKSKADIVKIGSGLNTPYQLTWSCYKGKTRHCGRCGTCTERKEAFELAGIPDPVEYAA